MPQLYPDDDITYQVDGTLRADGQSSPVIEGRWDHGDGSGRATLTRTSD